MGLDSIVNTGGSTAGKANVDANFNLQVCTPQAISETGYLVSIRELDSGSITGAPTRRSPWVTRDLRQAAGIDTGIFDYIFNAAAQDTGIWKYSFTTMTASQSGGYLLLNANSTATTTTGVSLTSWRVFDLEGHGGLRVAMVAQLSVAMVANQVIELGLFTATNTTAPADGVYFRITSAGIIGIINYNGVETPTAVLVASPLVATTQKYDIEITARGVEFWLDGVLLGILLPPAGNAEPFLEGALSLTFQQRNSGAVSGSQCQFKVGRCHVTYLDMQLAMPFSHQQAGEGLTCQQGTAGGAMGTTELYSNSLAAGAGAAMTNTTAALGTGLGGQFTTTATLAAGTDGIVCSYQVTVGSVTAKPRLLMITGVKIHSAITSSITGGPLLWAYSLAFGHTALSMATAEGTSFTTNPTTKAPRRVALGFETFTATAVAGVVGSPGGIYMPFNSPICVNPGEFVAVCAKNLGTVASAGTCTFLVTFDGYWI